MHELGSTMRILHPAPHIIGFYDGRIEGLRAHSAEANWLDDGAFTLGICSFAIVDGPAAIVYDTHLSTAHATLIRQHLTDLGVTSMRVVLSHWHTDHIAGNAVFQDCEIIAHALTAAALARHKPELEGGNPPIRPVVMPTRRFEGELTLQVGAVEVVLRHAEIHSHDGVVLWLPETGLLLAGDTLEDPITYVAEPDRLSVHLAELRRMAGWPIRRILPCHGSEQAIAAGGYGPGFIEATRLYVEKLQRCRTRPDLADPDLQHFAQAALATGDIAYFAAYETVHRKNLAAVTSVGGEVDR
jgi:glyoxylase-like metal-dependent hydrolase (beta-lactamase superfamily II)